MSILILILVLIALYLINRAIIKNLYLISYLLFKTPKLGLYLYFFLFLPGIIVHELSHFFMASLLAVPAGEIDIFPKKIDEKRYTLGSVKYAPTDPLRQNLIGIAPIIFGSIIITFLVKFGLKIPLTQTLPSLNQLAINSSNLLFLYLILTISNSIFISKEDQKSILALPTIIVLLILFLNTLGAFNILEKTKPLIVNISNTLSFSFLFALVVSFVLYLFLLIIRLFLQLVSQ